MLADIHLGLMVVQFVWNSITTYVQTPQGQQELADIEAVYSEVSAQSPGTSQAESFISNTLAAARAELKKATK